MTIRIVTDSTCGLPGEAGTEQGISVVPLYINFGGQSYLDGIELSREEFYERLPDCDPAPTTALPGPQSFLDVYQGLAGGGAAGILSIHVSGTLSGVANAARLAAQEMSAIPVTVLDSGTLSLGLGFLVSTAVLAAAQGRTMEEILAAVLINGFTAGDFSGEGNLLLSMPWGIASLVDLYVGFALFSGWIVYRERSLVRSLVWVGPMVVLGSFTASLYNLIALFTSGGDWQRFWLGRRYADS